MAVSGPLPRGRLARHTVKALTAAGAPRAVLPNHGTGNDELTAHPGSEDRSPSRGFGCSRRRCALARFAFGRLPVVGLPADITLSTTTLLNFVVLFAHIDLYKTSQPPFGWFRIMRVALRWFNTLLVASALLAFPSPTPAADSQAPASTGSETPPPAKSKKKEKKPKLIKSVRIYVETKHDIEERSLPAVVGRSSPMKFLVEKLPILNEVHVENAVLLDQPGSFQVMIKFNSLGSRILESYTAAAAGRHLLVMTEIEEEGRWIAAPLIRRRLGDGKLVFTPDASREDMDRLVKGLNQLVEKNRKQWLN